MRFLNAKQRCSIHLVTDEKQQFVCLILMRISWIDCLLMWVKKRLIQIEYVGFPHRLMPLCDLLKSNAISCNSGLYLARFYILF